MFKTILLCYIVIILDRVMTPPRDNIRTMMIIWRMREREKIIRTVLSCIMYHNCILSYNAHPHEQFLQVNYGLLGLSLVSYLLIGEIEIIKCKDVVYYSSGAYRRMILSP